MLRNNSEKQGGKRARKSKGEERKRESKTERAVSSIFFSLPSSFLSRSHSLSLFLPLLPVCPSPRSILLLIFPLSPTYTRRLILVRGTRVFMRFLIFALPPLSSSTKSLGMRSRYARRWNKHRLGTRPVSRREHEYRSFSFSARIIVFWNAKSSNYCPKSKVAGRKFSTEKKKTRFAAFVAECSRSRSCKPLRCLRYARKRVSTD